MAVRIEDEKLIITSNHTMSEEELINRIKAIAEAIQKQDPEYGHVEANYYLLEMLIDMLPDHRQINLGK